MYGVPYNADEIKRDLPAEWWPVMRTYTVRSWDAGTGELAIDFVVHGDEGVAAPWALHAAVGRTRIYVTGPGGAYAPNPAADWHLFVGDDSALPAIAAALHSSIAARKSASAPSSSRPIAHHCGPWPEQTKPTWRRRPGSARPVSARERRLEAKLRRSSTSSSRDAPTTASRSTCWVRRRAAVVHNEARSMSGRAARWSAARSAACRSAAGVRAERASRNGPDSGCGRRQAGGLLEDDVGVRAAEAERADPGRAGGASPAGHGTELRSG